MRRLPIVAVVLAVLLAISGASASRAAAATHRAPCVTGQPKPVCTFWDARATFIADGDTIDVHVDGEPKGATHRLRFIGINAMELSRYSKYPSRRRGSCHGLEATSFVERHIKASRWKVRIAAQHKSSRTGKRLRRSIWVKANGSWQDLAKLEMEAGLALWLPNPDEYAHNREYHVLADQAAAAEKGLFDPSSCGANPTPDAQLRVFVNWDADGDDDSNLNGEWADIVNVGPTPVSLAGWWFRESFLIYNAAAPGHVPGYEFPAYASVPAGGSVRLYVGCGTMSAQDPSRYYWCQKSPVFDNGEAGGRHLGDGGYLFSGNGALRSSMTYPCVVSCADPLQGKISIVAHPTTPESISVTNTSAETVDLGGHVLNLHLNGEADRFIFGYPFSLGTLLPAGQTIVIQPDGRPSQDGQGLKFLGRGPNVMADGGNTVSLRSSTDIVVACDAWGRARC